MRVRQFCSFCVCALALLAPSLARAEAVALKDDALSKVFTGALLELDTPLGTTVPIRFGANKIMSGDAGLVVGPVLGAAKDRGRWWVKDDQLCMKWFRWFYAKVRCLDVTLDGDKLNWRETSGETGTATLKESPGTLVAEAKPVVVVAKPVQAAPPPQEAQAPASAVPATPPPAEAVVINAAPAPSTPEPAKTEPPAPPKPMMAAAVFAPPSSPPNPSLPAVAAPEVSSAPASSRLKALVDRKPTPMKAPVQTRPEPKPVKAMEAAFTPPPSRPTFRVERVAPYDVLNVRDGPSEYHPPVGAIAPDGRGVEITGVCQGDWCPIRQASLAGWVNRFYLSED